MREKEQDKSGPLSELFAEHEASGEDAAKDISLRTPESLAHEAEYVKRREAEQEAEMEPDEEGDDSDEDLEDGEESESERVAKAKAERAKKVRHYLVELLLGREVYTSCGKAFPSSPADAPLPENVTADLGRVTCSTCLRSFLYIRDLKRAANV